MHAEGLGQERDYVLARRNWRRTGDRKASKASSGKVPWHYKGFSSKPNYRINKHLIMTRDSRPDEGLEIIMGHAFV